jgi:WD40 repeat protein
MKSTPHIYLSALAWAPEKSMLQKTIGMRFKDMQFISRKQRNWEVTRWGKTVGSQVPSVAYSPDGRHVAAGLEDGTILILESGTGELVVDPLRGHSDSVYSVMFSPNSQHLVSGSRDGIIRIWSFKTGLTVCGPLGDHEGSINSVCFSPDSQRIASGSADKTIRIWDAHSGAALGDPLKGHTGLVQSVAFPPDG